LYIDAAPTIVAPAEATCRDPLPLFDALLTAREAIATSVRAIAVDEQASKTAVPQIAAPKRITIE
jgi:hypothetical protein